MCKRNFFLFIMTWLSISWQGLAQHEHPASPQPANPPARTPVVTPADSLRHGGMSTTLPVSRLYALRQVHPTGRRVEYDLIIDEQTVNITGKPTWAMTLNGSIPGPTLTFTEGDWAVIRVHNKLKVESSIHWHGILLPNRQDGVSYLNTPPIEAGQTHTFEFPLVQTGTYWFHSHTRFQEQRGVYGSLVIQPQKPKHPVDQELVVVLSDWTNENPAYILKNLKRGNEWYSIKKNNAQPLNRILRHRALGAYLKQSWQRMPPMDISDVYYQRFLINGRDTSQYPSFQPGEKVRLRVINASATTYFHLNFAGGNMRLVAADGLDVQPVEVDRLLIAVAETYDLIITIPRQGAYELRATAQDGSGFASAFLGGGSTVRAPTIPRPDLYEMTRAMSAMPMGKMGRMFVQNDLEKINTMVASMADHSDMASSGHAAPAGQKAKEHTGHAGMKSTDLDRKTPRVLPDSKGGMENNPAATQTRESMHRTDHSGHERPNPELRSDSLQSASHNRSSMKEKAVDSHAGHEEMANTKRDSSYAGTDSTLKYPPTEVNGEKSESIGANASDMADRHQAMDSTHLASQQPSGPALQPETMSHSATNMLGPGNSPNYGQLQTEEPVIFPKGRTVRELTLVLSGDMRRYIWGLNGKPISKEEQIPIRRGEIVRFRLINGTMMLHPMHLHGHFFRVLNGRGDHSPFKHTVNVSPMETVVIEFLADEEKDWFFHCHLLYHMLTGMARAVSYEGSDYDEDMKDIRKLHLRDMRDNQWFFWGK
jgi:CopA family copper-resistance protein